MNNEKVQNTSEVKETPVFNSKDLENKSHAEQINHLDNALSKLDSMSEDVNVAKSELERTGKNGVIEQSSLRDRMGLKYDKLFKGKEIYDKKLSEMAKNVVNKNLDGLERGLGSQVIDLKKQIKSHEEASKNDLEAVRDIMAPGKLAEMERKMGREKDTLTFEKDLKEQELQEKLAEYPGSKKQEKLTNLMGEYGQIEATVSDKRNGLESDLKKYETAFNKIGGRGETSQEIKRQLQDKIDTLSKQCGEMRERERIVKERMNLLKKDQKELDPFAKRVNSIGKTREEIFQENKAKNGNEGINKEPKKTNEKQDATKSADASPETGTVAKTNAETKAATKDSAIKNQGGRSKAIPDKNGSKTFDHSGEEMENKLSETIKTPRQWAELIKINNRDLVKLIGKDITISFTQNKELKQKINMSGLEAMNFFRGLLQHRKVQEAAPKAREAIEKILK